MEEKQPKSLGPYWEAHLVVAAIRVVDYRKQAPPSAEEIADCLGISLESAFRIIRKLHDLQVVELVEGAFGSRLFVRDHLKIEEIPKSETGGGLAEALKEFQDSRKGLSQKIESIKADQNRKKKDLFAELEKKLKTDLNKE